ncbi:conserved exported hypothetical protein [Verrucomicrobia bacterium]|nr:conserved exported hypothetical protein [Verrucomicrobiota bacterium]
MNRLLLLFLAAGVSAAAACWQQQSINSVRAATARLSEQLVQTRAALESEQGALASAHTQLQKLEADLQATKRQRADLAGTKALALPTPEEEGWWPQNRPYFYLAKTLLPKVRMGERHILMDPNTGQEATSTSPQGRCVWLSDQPFSAQGLNPHLAMLLGMSDEEVAAVNDSYSGFVQGVREVEAARVQRVEPPVRDDEDGCMVVARLPVLTPEIEPLRERWEQSLAQTLGADRADILRENAQRFFDQDMDQLGAEPREFLRNGNNLWLRLGGLNIHFRGPTYGLVPTQDWQYGHLFGPGAPCELQ